MKTEIKLQITRGNCANDPRYEDYRLITGKDLTTRKDLMNLMESIVDLVKESGLAIVE